MIKIKHPDLNTDDYHRSFYTRNGRNERSQWPWSISSSFPSAVVTPCSKRSDIPKAGSFAVRLPCNRDNEVDAIEPKQHENFPHPESVF